MSQPYVTERMLRWRRRTDGPLLIIAIGSVPLLLVEVERHLLTERDRVILTVVNVVVFVSFAVDYIVEFALTSDKRVYVRGEWINALVVLTAGLALVPQFASVGAARLLRGAPILRAVVAVLRVVAVGGAVARESRRLLRRRAASFAMGGAVLTWLTAAAAFSLAEDVGADGRVESFLDALWWSAATITTVGYGDITPVTTAGRAAGVVAMVVGISTFAVITARVAAFLVTDDDREAGEDGQSLSQPPPSSSSPSNR
jgi:voltage-gated potassium channel